MITDFSVFFWENRTENVVSYMYSLLLPQVLSRRPNKRQILGYPINALISFVSL